MSKIEQVEPNSYIADEPREQPEIKCNCIKCNKELEVTGVVCGECKEWSTYNINRKVRFMVDDEWKEMQMWEFFMEYGPRFKSHFRGSPINTLILIESNQINVYPIPESERPATCPTCSKVPEVCECEVVHHGSTPLSWPDCELKYSTNVTPDWSDVTCPKCIEKREELSDKPKKVPVSSTHIREYAIENVDGIYRIPDGPASACFLDTLVSFANFRGVKFEGQRDDYYHMELRMFIDTSDGEVAYAATREQLESGELKAAVPVVAAFEEIEA